MTAREKLAIEHPEKLDDLEPGGCMGCPEDYGYLPDADFCTSNCDRYGDEFERCKKCWDRELPETIEQKLAAIPVEEPDEIDRKMIEMIEKEENMSECCKETMCTTCIHQDVCSLKGKFLDAQKAVDGLVVYDELPTGLLGQVKLRDIGFIKPVELECVHYVYKGSAGVKGGLHA